MTGAPRKRKLNVALSDIAVPKWAVLTAKIPLTKGSWFAFGKERVMTCLLSNAWTAWNLCKTSIVEKRLLQRKPLLSRKRKRRMFQTIRIIFIDTIQNFTKLRTGSWFSKYIIGTFCQFAKKLVGVCGSLWEFFKNFSMHKTNTFSQKKKKFTKLPQTPAKFGGSLREFFINF